MGPRDAPIDTKKITFSYIWRKKEQNVTSHQIDHLRYLFFTGEIIMVKQLNGLILFSVISLPSAPTSAANANEVYMIQEILCSKAQNELPTCMGLTTIINE